MERAEDFGVTIRRRVRDDRLRGCLWRKLEMAAINVGSEIAPKNLRLMLLSFGLKNPYRVLRLQDVALAMPHVRQEELERALNQLADEGLVTRFARRYCFNKALPPKLLQLVESFVTPSGTIRLAP